MKRLAVLGASGHGKVVADTAEVCGWNTVVFFDDAWPEVLQNGAWTVEGDSTALFDTPSLFDGVIVAIGNNEIRAEKLGWLDEVAADVVSLIHPSACVSRYAEIGRGTVVMPGVVVNAGSFIESGVILNTGCSIDHDCLIRTSAHISPGARLAGGVEVGDHSWLGIGCSVKQGISIGRDVIVGAGAVVVSDLPDGVIAVGVPAKPLSR